MRDVDEISSGGIFVGKAATYSPEDPKLSRVIARTVRGLYYTQCRERLPDDYGVATYIVANFDRRKTEWMSQLRRITAFVLDGKLVTIHADVFRYAFRFLPGYGATSVWLLTFYGYTPIICFTMERSRYQDDRSLL